MRNFLLSFLFFGTPILLWGQATKTLLSSAYTRLTAYSSFQQDALSFAGNQAALASVKNISAAMYGERRFLLNDLGNYRLGFALPTSFGNLALQCEYFGSVLYNESKLALAYARKFGKLDVGIQFNYHAFHTAGYGRAAAINAETGFIFHITEKFHTGIHIYNPTSVSIGKNADEKLPFIYSLGWGYDFSDKFFIAAEIQKTESLPIGFNAGVQYNIGQKLFGRIGVHSASSLIYFGCGFLWKGVRIDATASIHQHLGVTPGIMIIYNSKGK